MNKTWYVVQTQVKRELEAQTGLMKKNYEVFLPMYRKKNKKGEMILPLFPGYLFTTFDRNARQWQEIHRMHGVSKLLGYDAESNTVCPCRDGAIPGLREFCEEGSDIVDFDKAYPSVSEQFEQGDEVKILSGMFKNHTASYWNQTGNGHMIILSLLSRPVRVILRNEEITRTLLRDTIR